MNGLPVTTSNDIMGGTPVFTGTRVPVQSLIEFLEAGDSSNPDLPNAADRVHIAEQIMSHAADPQLIDQGGHYTCAVAALESQMFTRNPSQAARMIADVATEGAFETASGKTVRPDSSLLKPDSEAQEHPTPDRSRSYASQLF